MSVGWLFADLLLAVAMLFLVANTIAPARPAPTPTPVPTATPTPTPTPVPTVNALLLDKHLFTLVIQGINPDKVSTGDQGALSDLKQKIQTEATNQGLQGRRAGIAIAYGGADNNTAAQIDRASAVAAQVYNVLDMLGGQKFVFCNTVHYNDVFTLGYPSTTVVIDTYLFDQSVGGC